MNRPRTSVRSRGSSSTNTSNNRGRKVKDCCRKLVAFMCTQVGVGGLIVGYALIGATIFISIEKVQNNEKFEEVEELRRDCAKELWDITEKYNTLNLVLWENRTDEILRKFQDRYAKIAKTGFDNRTPDEIWSFPAALMFCLSVFTMIGYGNMVPKTQWGKTATVIYASFGIPLYILYFLNMGKVLAQTFKWLYTWLHECTDDDDFSDDGEIRNNKKKVVVPSTACLWVILLYVLIGTIMFAQWEKWGYLDSVYFCVTSLCKIGMGDFVPGGGTDDNISEKQSKIVINFVYMLFGMGIVAMCYNLMREDVKVKMQEMKEDIKLCLEDVRSKFARCCGDKNYY